VTEAYATETATTEGSGTLAPGAGWARNIVDRERRVRKHRYSQCIEESIVYRVDLERLMVARGTTVASAGFSVISGDVSIDGTLLSDNSILAALSMANSGKGLVKMTATQSDGNSRTVFIAINAVDPTGSTTDYL
jgi:hypothetical protein